MLKRIILIRHGESQKDKQNPKRGLTKRGVKQIEDAAISIKKIMIGNCKIITTDTNRTRQSSIILSKILDLDFETTELNLRVDNFDLIERENKNKSNLVFKYFKTFEDGKLNAKIATPVEILNRFIDLISNYKCDTIIIVGHSGALESFIVYQDKFIPAMKFKKELEYGEFIVLNRNDKLLNI